MLAPGEPRGERYKGGEPTPAAITGKEKLYQCWTLLADAVQNERRGPAIWAATAADPSTTFPAHPPLFAEKRANETCKTAFPALNWPLPLPDQSAK